MEALETGGTTSRDGKRRALIEFSTHDYVEHDREMCKWPGAWKSVSRGKEKKQEYR